MKTTADRIREALELRDASINGLFTRIDKIEPKVRGSSYGSTRNYLGLNKDRDAAEPPLEWLFAAADALEVSRDYLAFGKGHLTEVHEAAAVVAAEAQPDLADWTTRLLGKDIHREVMEGMGLEIENDATVPYWVAPLGQLWSQFQQFAPPREAASPPYPPETQIAQALVWPVKAFGIEPERLQDSGLLERYILAATPALLILGDAYRWQLRRADQDARDSNDLRDEENEDA